MSTEQSKQNLQGTLDALYKAAQQRDFAALVALGLDYKSWVTPSILLNHGSVTEWRAMISDLIDGEHENDLIILAKLSSLGLLTACYQLSDITSLYSADTPTPIWSFLVMATRKNSITLKQANDNETCNMLASNIFIDSAHQSLIRFDDIKGLEQLRKDAAFALSDREIFLRAGGEESWPMLQHYYPKLNDWGKANSIHDMQTASVQKNLQITLEFLLAHEPIQDRKFLEVIASKWDDKPIMEILSLRVLLKQPRNFLMVWQALGRRGKSSGLLKHYQRIMTVAMLKNSRVVPS